MMKPCHGKWVLKHDNASTKGLTVRLSQLLQSDRVIFGGVEVYRYLWLELPAIVEAVVRYDVRGDEEKMR